MTCDPETVECILREIEKSVDALSIANPWPDAILTGLATLLGASLAFGFALLLRRRQRRDELADRLNDDMGKVVNALHDLTESWYDPGATMAGGRRLATAQATAAALTALRAAKLHATLAQRKVIDAAIDNVTRHEWELHFDRAAVEQIAQTLVDWRTGGTTDEQATRALSAKYVVPAFES